MGSLKIGLRLPSSTVEQRFCKPSIRVRLSGKAQKRYFDDKKTLKDIDIISSNLLKIAG
jgi:hypothetical protein